MTLLDKNDAYELANQLLIRMRVIDNDQQDYDSRCERLWDAVLDEIRAICPDLDYGATLRGPFEVKL